MQLYEKLKKYSQSDAYPFHMPGHKRRLGTPPEVLPIDITEIDGFDNLHHAEGILKETQERAARLYGARDSFLLVNGSTAGILAALSACVRPGGRLLLARNSHKAAYHAAELRALQTVYLYPQKKTDAQYLDTGISPADVRSALAADNTIEAVFVTSPTYEGVVSPIGEIARAAHAYGVPLIVDEAHGAHFGFHPYFPESSLKLGADLVIHSLHKTLPSLTQTALLHRNGTLVSRERLEKFLDIYQTSSPSYVLMASMEACIALLEEERETLFSAFAQRLEDFSCQARKLKKLRLLEADGGQKDPSKLLLSADGHSGKWLCDRLRREFQLEMEMAAGDYVVALTSLADSQEGFDRLLAALREVDASLLLEEQEPKGGRIQPASTLRNEQVCTIAEADGWPKRRIPFWQSEGAVSAEYLYLYPPGIPMLVPGERVSREVLAEAQACRAAGLSLQGLSDHTGETLQIVSLTGAKEDLPPEEPSAVFQG